MNIDNISLEQFYLFYKLGAGLTIVATSILVIAIAYICMIPFWISLFENKLLASSKCIKSFIALGIIGVLSVAACAVFPGKGDMQTFIAMKYGDRVLASKEFVELFDAVKTRIQQQAEEQVSHVTQ